MIFCPYLLRNVIYYCLFGQFLVPVPGSRDLSSVVYGGPKTDPTWRFEWRRRGGLNGGDEEVLMKKTRKFEWRRRGSWFHEFVEKNLNVMQANDS